MGKHFPTSCPVQKIQRHCIHCNIIHIPQYRGWDVAQWVEHRIGTLPTQVRFPGAARNFSPRVSFQFRLPYGVRTPPSAIACIYDICAHVKDPVVHVRVRWIMETVKHPACTVGWIARLCRSWLFPGEGSPNFSWSWRKRFLKKCSSLHSIQFRTLLCNNTKHIHVTRYNFNNYSTMPYNTINFIVTVMNVVLQYTTNIINWHPDKGCC